MFDLLSRTKTIREQVPLLPRESVAIHRTGFFGPYQLEFTHDSILFHERPLWRNERPVGVYGHWVGAHRPEILAAVCGIVLFTGWLHANTR